MPDDSPGAPAVGRWIGRDLRAALRCCPGAGRVGLPEEELHIMPLLASLFRRPGAGRPAPRHLRPQANRFRPGLETLEDRTVPVLISSQVNGVSFVFSNVNSFVATFVRSTQATNTEAFVPVACPTNVP